MVISTWPQANANQRSMKLQLVAECFERESSSSTTKRNREEEDCCVSKAELTMTNEQQQQQRKRHQHHHHYQHQQQQQGQKSQLIMEQNGRTRASPLSSSTTTASRASSVALKRSLLHIRPRRNSVEDNIKPSNECENDEEYNLENVCSFATTVAIEKQQQQQQRHWFDSKRCRFKDKVENSCGGHLIKVTDSRKRGSLCQPLFVWPIIINNNNYALSATHLFLSILIFTLHLSISNCLQPVFREHKVPLLHQQNVFQHNDGQVSNNTILSECK